MKQRMQVQGSRTSWNSTIIKDSISRKSGKQNYWLLLRDVPGWQLNIEGAGPKRTICWVNIRNVSTLWKALEFIQQSYTLVVKGSLLTNLYCSTLARDVPFAGLMVMFYEALKDLTEYGKQIWIPNLDHDINSSVEGLFLGGLAGGFSAYLTTPLDVIKTRLQVQGSIIRYSGGLDAIRRIWMIEGVKGLFRGSVPRITWYIPASALTFMAVEFLRDQFNEKLDDGNMQEVANMS
ncbi:hypothetical protein OIU78_016976 [Salix suchowensis]|nr:hypothetical protein OIU78_016976 [Salix suchowensis]